MPHINPRQLKYWRTIRSLSMQDLADASSLSKTTIYRNEAFAATKKTIRASTLRALARGLGVKEEQLADETEPVAEKPRRESQDRSQVSFKLGNGTRNAFSFVASRYRINPRTIIELAPLLFVMVAEDSLRKRAERLSALRDARLGSGTLPNTYTHAAEQLENGEDWSIRNRDIFGLALDIPEGYPLPLSADVDQVGQWNPFELHVREWFKQSGEEGGISEWEYDGPFYSVCREAALAFAGDDEDLATALQEGWVGIHEVPAELRGSDMAEQRLQWFRARVAAAKATHEEAMAAVEEKIRAQVAEFALDRLELVPAEKSVSVTGEEL